MANIARRSVDSARLRSARRGATVQTAFAEVGRPNRPCAKPGQFKVRYLPVCIMYLQSVLLQLCAKCRWSGSVAGGGESGDEGGDDAGCQSVAKSYDSY